MVTERTAVYRLFDAEGELLYIGMSGNLDVRWGSHATDKPWWKDVAERRVTWYETREEAAVEEMGAIRSEHPRYNSVGTPRHREVSGAATKLQNMNPAECPGLAAIMSGLAAVVDPAERAKQASEVIELARMRLMPGARKIRQDAVNELRGQGLTLAAVGELIGQSTSRTQQISEGRTGGKPRAKDDAED